LQRQVVRQREANATLHVLDFVFTIGIERREAGGVAGGRFGKVQPLVRTAVPDDQASSPELIRQDDDQARHHAIQFFAVAMRKEESPLLIDQQLVQLGLQLFRGKSKLFRNRFRQLSDRQIPSFAEL